MIFLPDTKFPKRLGYFLSGITCTFDYSENKKRMIITISGNVDSKHSQFESPANFKNPESDNRHEAKHIPRKGGPENDVTNRNNTFMTWNLMHMAKMLRKQGIQTYGNQRTQRSEERRVGKEC
jgi:hypothetical protein